MELATQELGGQRSPLEDFVRDYVEGTGGAWDEVEPQVYDVLLPSPSCRPGEALGQGVLRIAFDPEALPEHRTAQLASFGTPLVDDLLKDALQRGGSASAYREGLNLSPHDLLGRVRRVLRLPDDYSLEPQRLRALWFPQAVFWFEATFVSDQKEQEILCVGIDLASGRETRHMDGLLDFSRLSQQPSLQLADARHDSLLTAYRTARQQVVRTIAGLANIRRRELAQRLDRQVRRMRTYYGDLRSELDAQARRMQDRGADPEKYAARKSAVDREEHLRVSELERKSALKVHLRIVNLLVVRQPKLRLTARVVRSGPSPLATEIALVWDPLVETLEAPACPQCGAPTYVLRAAGRRLGCPNCPRGGVG